ncbi:zinc-binding alcohol dehydrogenase family protein [Phanerochaete sordida]|uniref:Zinc-binding alcohol dehydrogenase family protein n=1 Tax=Phanerochaete sordida TaxID=48140 RepID=A0A9P3LD18_9APHY|nr:zinc-binding alcohol dehydrogenase family protein [Phanerochaete sordida]
MSLVIPKHEPLLLSSARQQSMHICRGNVYIQAEKALYLLEAKGRFAIKDKAIQEPGPGEVLVQIHAAGLNPADQKVHERDILVKEYPAILGLDAAGIVKKLGADVSNLAVGDRVVFQGWYDDRRGALQQYAVADAGLVAKLPSTLTFDQAATFPVPLATAAFGLYSSKKAGGIELTAPWEDGGRGKYAGQPILVIGGSSAVGQFAIQLAKLSGFGPIIAVASVRNTAHLKSIGATHVVDRAAPLSALGSAIAAATRAPLLVAYDAVATPETQNAAYAALAPGGKLVHVQFAKVDEAVRTPDKTLALPYGNVLAEQNGDDGHVLYKALEVLLASGELKPNNVEVLPNGLEGATEGLKKLEQGLVSAAKLVVHPQDTA